MTSKTSELLFNELNKVGVSNYLLNNGYDLLDLFFKRPCDECKKLESWDQFHLLPDLLIKHRDLIFLAFIIKDLKIIESIQIFVAEYSEILPFKYYLVEEKNLYELLNLADLSNKTLLTDDLKIPNQLSIGTSSQTIKSKKGEWGEKRGYGLKGEAELNNFLKRSGAKILDLNFNAPCDNCLEIQNWRKYNKLPDGIAKLDGEIFFYDSKAKSGRTLIMNERDYKEYQDKIIILPVKVYILIFTRDWKRLREIYVHTINFTPKQTSKQKNGNITVELENEVEQVY